MISHLENILKQFLTHLSVFYGIFFAAAAPRCAFDMVSSANMDAAMALLILSLLMMTNAQQSIAFFLSCWFDQFNVDEEVEKAFVI